MPTDLILVSPHVDRLLQHRDWAPSKYLGIAYLAASAREAGLSVRVIDARGERLTREEVVNRICEWSPRVVGFTAMTHEVNRAADLADGVRSRGCTATLVVGGAHATALPEQCLEDFAAFDVAVKGEAERTIVEVFHALDDGGGLDGVQGLAWRRPEITFTGERPVIEDLDVLPRPAWDLFPFTPHFPVFSARGCPYQCNFCMRALGSRYRFRSSLNVVEELEELVDTYGARSVSFEDETFVIRRDRADELLDLVIERGLNLRLQWLANLHAKSLDPELARKMVAAGCISVGTGVESGNPDILARAGKGLTVDLAADSARILKDAGLQVRAFFIFGHPGETPAAAWDTVRLAARINPDQASFGIMVPYPSTEIARMVERGEGGYRVLSLDWSSYDKYLGGALELEMFPRYMLEIFQVVAYLWLYLSNGRFFDLMKFMRRHARAGWILLWRIMFSHSPVRSARTAGIPRPVRSS